MIVLQNPNALYGLCFLAIPIIIHLFNFRKYKKIYFTNISILQKNKSSTSSIKKLKNLLLLISRLLIITTLVFAFTNPINQEDLKNKKTKEYTTSIIIDNNLLLQNTINNIPSIELLKQKAIETIKNSNQKKINIITNNIIKKKLLKDDAILFVSTIEPIYNEIDTIAIKKNESDLNYIFSNFNNSSLIQYLNNTDTNKNYQLIDFTSNQKENLKVSNVYLKQNNIELNKNHQLNFSIINEGKNLRNSEATLYINQDVKQIVSFKIPEKTTIDTFFNIFPVSKINEAVISIEDSPIYYDNDFNFNFLAKSKYKTLLVNDSKSITSIEVFLRSYDQTELKTINLNELNNENLLSFDIIIINEISKINKQTIKAISKAIKEEKTVVIIPSNIVDISSINKIAKQYNFSYFKKLTQKDTIKLFPNLLNDFYTETFESEIKNNNQLPEISYYFKSLKNGTNTTLLSDKEEGKQTFLEENNDNGKLFLFYFPFESNINWTYHPFFTITIMRIFETSKGNSINSTSLKSITNIKERNLNINNNYVLETNKNKIVLSKKYFENNSYLSTSYNKLTQGNFKLTENDSLVRYVSLNYTNFDIINNNKNLLKLKSKKHLEIKDFNSSVNVTSNTQWYKVLILLALLFVIFEILIIRFYK